MKNGMGMGSGLGPGLGVCILWTTLPQRTFILKMKLIMSSNTETVDPRQHKSAEFISQGKIFLAE